MKDFVFEITDPPLFDFEMEPNELLDEIQKHLQGQHNQLSHGSWSDNYESALDMVNKLVSKEDSPRDLALKLIKENGFTDPPKVATDGNNFRSRIKVGLWRGFGLIAGQPLPEDKIQLFLDSKTPYISDGRWGSGMYTSTEKSGTDLYSRSGGISIEMGLTKDAKFFPYYETPTDNYNKFRDEIKRKYPLHPALQKEPDITTAYALANGYDGMYIMHPTDYAGDGDYYSIWNPSKLVVNPETLPQGVHKHLQGQHDQSSHGSWAGNKGAEFKPNNLTGEHKVFNGHADWSDVQPTNEPDDYNIEFGSGVTLDSPMLKTLGQGKVFTEKADISSYVSGIFEKYGYGKRLISYHPDKNNSILVDGIEAGVVSGVTDGTQYDGMHIPCLVYKPQGVSEFVLLHEISHILEGHWLIANPRDGGHNQPFLDTWKHLLRNENMDKQANLLDMFTYKQESNGVFS